MTNEENKVPKYRALCMNCSHEFSSKTSTPRCGECGSSDIINTKELHEKYDILKLRADVSKWMNHQSKLTKEHEMKLEELRRGYVYLKEQVDTVKKEQADLDIRLKALEVQTIHNPTPHPYTSMAKKTN